MTGGQLCMSACSSNYVNGALDLLQVCDQKENIWMEGRPPAFFVKLSSVQSLFSMFDTFRTFPFFGGQLAW